MRGHSITHSLLHQGSVRRRVPAVERGASNRSRCRWIGRWSSAGRAVSVAPAGRHTLSSRFPLEGCVAALVSADPDGVGYRAQEDLAVADVAGVGRPADGADRRFGSGVGDHNLQLDLGEQIDLVRLLATPRTDDALLYAAPGDSGDVQAADALSGERILDGTQLLRPDNRLYLLHCHHAPYLSGLTRKSAYLRSPPVTWRECYRSVKSPAAP